LQVTSGSNITRISALEVASGSAQSQLSALQAQTGSYATTGSNTFVGNQTITGSIFGSGSLTINGCITATGQIVAQTINVQQVTSSIVYSCGSNVFGCAISNTQQLTGSVGITGSLSVNGVSAVVGTGTTNYLPKFTGASTIGDSIIQESSSNIGIGVSPSYKLDVNGIGQFRDDIRFSTTNSSIGYTDALRFVQLGVDTRLTLSGGNLGLGVTPSAWTTSSGRRAIEVGALGNALFGAGSSDIRVLSNVYVNTSNQRTYANNGLAGEYQIGDGVHIWYTAPSGTANCAISFTQAMTLTAAGSLGVGTPTPPTKFAVKDGTDTVIQYYASGADGYLGMGNEAGSIGGASKSFNLLTGTQFTFSTAATERMRITSGGNVGIGTTSPGQLLTVYQDTNGDARISLNNPNTGASARTFLYAITTGNRYVGMLAYGANATGTTYGLSNASLGILEAGGDISNLLISSPSTIVFGANNSERMRITSGGNVGIGTTSPGQLLHVAGFTRTHGISLNDGTVAGFIGYEKQWLGTGSNDVAIASEGGNNIRFYTNGGTDVRMIINTSGNVGIGTTSPSQLLTVEGSTTEVLSVGTSSQKLFFRPDGGGVMISTSTNQAGEGIYFGNASDFMYFQTASTERMRITSGGNVSIGCGINATFNNGNGCRYNFTALNTAQDLVGVCANNGIIVIRDHTEGGTGAFLIDPNQGVICMASNIPATVSIAWSGSVWRWCLTSGDVPRCLGYGFYGA
jgi:hypothetical protein